MVLKELPILAALPVKVFSRSGKILNSLERFLLLKIGAVFPGQTKLRWILKPITLFQDYLLKNRTGNYLANAADKLILWNNNNNVYNDHPSTTLPRKVLRAYCSN
jgi:hypothetical protein